MTTAFIDLETRSEVNLKTAGTAAYAAHPSTEIICLVIYANDNYIILPDQYSFNLLPKLLSNYTDLVAHNALFEYLILSRYIDVDKFTWHCTMARALAVEFPLSLDKIAHVFGEKKNSEGLRLIQTYSTIKNGQINPIPNSDYQLFVEYCKHDAWLTKLLYEKLPPTNDFKNMLSLTLKMNRIGLPVDVSLAQKVKDTLLKLKQQESERIDINPKSTQQIIKFCSELGLKLDNCRANTIESVLQQSNLDERIKSVLLIRQHLSKASTAKYDTILSTHINSRMVGCFQYYGAHTGRDAGRGIQPQNFPRGTVIGAELLKDIDNSLFLEFMGTDAYQVAKDGLRSIIRTTGVFYCADFASIELRVLLWLAKDYRALSEIRAGKDLYAELAKSIFNTSTVTGEQRQIGKSAMLGLGYGMGDGFNKITGEPLVNIKGEFAGFKRYIKAQNLNVSDNIIQKAVRTYREHYAHSVIHLWERLNHFYITELQNPFRKSEFITVPLPSGRLLHYFCPKKLVNASIINNTMYLSANAPLSMEERKKTLIEIKGQPFYRKKIYGGKLVENLVQAVARDLLFEAHIRLHDKEFNVIGRFHDEILTEEKDDSRYRLFQELMKKSPAWASGLPIDIESWKGSCYRK